MNFLANPWKLWETGKPQDQQTVLKLVFDAPIPYARNTGFRTAKTTLPFKVLDDLKDDEGEMADTSVESSNAVFDILEEWEAHLKASGISIDEMAVDKFPLSTPEEPQP